MTNLKDYGNTTLTENGIKINFLASKPEYDFSELWRLLGKNKDDYIFDVLYHIGQKEVEKNDFFDFCCAYLDALKATKDKDFAEKSPVHYDFEKYFKRTGRESDTKIILSLITG